MILVIFCLDNSNIVYNGEFSALPNIGERIQLPDGEDFKGSVDPVLTNSDGSLFTGFYKIVKKDFSYTSEGWHCSIDVKAIKHK